MVYQRNTRELRVYRGYTREGQTNMGIIKCVYVGNSKGIQSLLSNKSVVYLGRIKGVQGLRRECQRSVYCRCTNKGRDLPGKF